MNTKDEENSEQREYFFSTDKDKKCMEFTAIDEVHVAVTKTDDFKKLQNLKDEYVVLHSGGESYDVHPKILGMVSKYFNSYFKWNRYVSEVDLEENTEPIKDNESIACVVQYANTGVVSFSSLNVEKLYQVANYLLCLYIIQVCEKVIIQNMQTKDTSEIVSMIKLCDKYQSPKILKSVCANVSENFDQLSTELLQLCEYDFELLFSNKFLSVFRKGIPVDDPVFVLQKIVTAYCKSKNNINLLLKLQNDINETFYSNCKRNIEFGDESYGLSAKVFLKYPDFQGGIRSDRVCREIYTDKNDRPKKMSLWYVDWDGRAVLGGMTIEYKSGTKIEYNTKPRKCVSEKEFYLDDDEVVIEVNLYLGCLIKDLSFKTNFGREIGPFSGGTLGPWGFERKEISRGEHSYLLSLRCRIVQLRYSSAISCLNFAWITYPCDEFKGNSIWTNVSEDDYIDAQMTVRTQILPSLHRIVYTAEQRQLEKSYRNCVEVDSPHMDSTTATSLLRYFPTQYS